MLITERIQASKIRSRVRMQDLKNEIEIHSPPHIPWLSPPFPSTSYPVKVTLVFDCPCGATLTCSFKMMCNSQDCSSAHLFLSGVPTAGQ